MIIYWNFKYLELDSKDVNKNHNLKIDLLYPLI